MSGAVGTGTLARRAVAGRRRWLIGWSLGIGAFVALNVGFWPAVRDQGDELNQSLEQLPESVKSLLGIGGGVDLFSPVGYLSGQVYALALPLLLLIAAIGAAASLAGDEERGLLETTYALPLPRWRVVLERWLAVMALTAALAAVALLAVVVTVGVVELDIGMAELVWATFAALLLTWASAALALAVGAATGRRATAIAVATVVVLVSYVVGSLADAGIGVFRRLEPVSLFGHYDAVGLLLGDRQVGSLVVLALVVAAAVAAACVAVGRRDLRAA